MKVLVALAALFRVADATMASPWPYEAKNADGSTVKLRMNGDELTHYESDGAGFPVVKKHGRYVYATLGADGKLAATRHAVGVADPAKIAGLSASVVKPVPHPERVAAKRVTHHRRPRVKRHKDGSPTVMKNLVIPMMFKDHKRDDRPVPSMSDIDTLMNHGGAHDLAPTGSVRDVYLVSSLGALELDSTVVDWVTLSEDEAHYGDDRWWNIFDALEEALNEVQDSGVNFKDFDADDDGVMDGITFLHSGYGAEWGATDCFGQAGGDRVWSHKSALGGNGWTSNDGVTVKLYHISPGLWGTCGSEIGRVGVIAHETGHFLGWPDYYDYGSGSGLGSFELMANSWGFDGSQHYPPIVSARLKEEIGWLDPTEIDELDGEQTFTLEPAATNAQAFKITAGFPPGEYLLVENRQAILFDADFSASGLCIYHVNEAKTTFDSGIGQAGAAAGGYPGHSNWPAQHYYVALQPVDSNYYLEKAQWFNADSYVWQPGSTMEPGRIEDTIYPNTDSYAAGYFVQTGLTIKDIIQQSNGKMKFTLSSALTSKPTPMPTTDEPTIYPTRQPTGEPTIYPTWYPSARPGNPSSMPIPAPTFIPSTLSPTGENDGPCEDSNGDATDAYGDGCAWYEENPTGCGMYDDDDFTATEVCCVCGSNCEDSAGGATDSYGDGCEWYESSPWDCGGYDDTDFEAINMC